MRETYPRVSDIIGIQTERSMRSIPIEALANAAIRGTKIHEYCAALTKLLWVDEIEEEYKSYVSAFMEWYEENVKVLIYSETRLYHDVKRFTGMPDMIVKLKSGKAALIDIKSSATISKSWGVQLAAYSCLASHNKIGIDEHYVIHLKKYQVKKETKIKADAIPYTDLNNEMHMFNCCLECYDYFNRKEKADATRD